MAKPTRRADLVEAVKEAVAITADAIPAKGQMLEEEYQEIAALRRAVVPVVLRELLDVEVE